jgi:hypothetical protein
VVDEQLRTTAEKVRERGAALVGVEGVLLVDADPRQLLPLARELVTAAGVLLLGGEQLAPRCLPFLTRSGLHSSHSVSTWDLRDRSYVERLAPRHEASRGR